MLNYSIKRILSVIPVLLIVSFVVFMIVRLVPGDPVKNMLGMNATEEQILLTKAELGLDQPLLKQYITYMKGLLHGDLGKSILNKQSVASLMGARFPTTIKIAVFSTIFSITVGMILGIMAALNHSKVVDSIIMVVSLLAVSTPVFFLGLLMMLVFSVWLKVLPSVGLTTPLHYILPVVTLGMQSVGIVARTTRSAMLDVLGEDYVRTAKAAGVPHGTLVYKNAMKNALIPVITIAGLRFGNLLTGAALTETVFAIQGIGTLLVNSVSQRDYPLIQGCILMFAVVFVFVNLITDLCYAVVDPRVSYH